MDFERKLERYAALAESALKDSLRGMEDNTAAEAMRYSAMGGGKRLRPVILLSSAEAFGGRVEDAAPLAAAMEMIHTYSLIHDDLPAMDDDDYRRGRLSCHKKYGEAYAVLAGDALLNRAYEAIFSAMALHAGSKTIERYIGAAAVIANAAGINGMISGQTADIYYENTEPDEQTLVYINERKTGALISASFEAGALIGGADARCAKLFAEAGMNIGKAFQIRDDVLDIEGSLETLGKLTGSDQKNNKATYVTVLGKQKCAERIRELTDTATEQLNSTGADTEFLVTLITNLAFRKK